MEMLSQNNDECTRNETTKSTTTTIIITIIIITYICHALINTLSAQKIHINLNMIFYTHVELICIRHTYMLNIALVLVRKLWQKQRATCLIGYTFH